MFTGLVETLATVQQIDSEGAGKRLIIEATISSELTLGESVCVNGACLTVVGADAKICQFQAGPETLERTNLGELRPRDRVNLERSLRVGDRLGGHIVQGHVDGIGRIGDRLRQGEWELVWFTCASSLSAQMVPKGSVAVDGVSLTLVDVADGRFSVALIPHTLGQTTLGFKTTGTKVNLETDLLAKYVWKCLQTGGITLDTLRRTGFLAEPGP